MAKDYGEIIELKFKRIRSWGIRCMQWPVISFTIMRINLNREHIYRALRGNLLFDDEMFYENTKRTKYGTCSTRIQKFCGSSRKSKRKHLYCSDVTLICLVRVSHIPLLSLSLSRLPLLFVSIYFSIFFSRQLLRIYLQLFLFCVSFVRYQERIRSITRILMLLMGNMIDFFCYFTILNVNTFWMMTQLSVIL